MQSLPAQTFPTQSRTARAVQEARRWAIATVSLFAIVSVYRWLDPANRTTVALTLLLLVLLLARWGLRYAVATSLAAMLCYNFYFLPPVGTLTITDPQNWLTLFVFLVTSAIGSQLAEQARREAEQARTRQGELELLYRLSRELLQAEDVARLQAMIAPAVKRVTAALAVELLILDGKTRGIGEHFTVAEYERARSLLKALPPTTEWMTDAVRAVPLRAGVRPRGLLLLRGANLFRLSSETLDAMGGLVSVSLDRAQALEEVTRTRAAQESERMRTVMIDALTHELRTPLTAIKAAATTLLTASELGVEDRKELLEVIDEEADRLNRLVARAVEVTQLEARDAQMVFAPAAPARIAEEALEQSAAALGRHAIHVDVSESLPAVTGDAAYLAKVLQNLLENAAKYSRAGTDIRLAAYEERGDLVFTVHDAGVGIDASEIALIFDRFYRAKTQSDTVPGTGMGLAISRAIAEAHGGSLAVESELDVGSVFRLTLPLVGAATPLQAPGQRP